MKRIGIFLDEITDQNLDSRQKFSKLGNNTGNMLFWHSLKTQLDLDVRPRWYLNHLDQLNLDEYKAFVTTDLIWIRQMQDFSYLNQVLDGLGDLPLIPISIGLQCNDFDLDFKIHPNTVKVLKRISEKCVMGVRGDYTAQVLDRHGIDHYMVIGCPSMYMPVDGLKTVANDKHALQHISMNFETFYSKIGNKKADFLEYGANRNYEFIEQAESVIDEKLIVDQIVETEIEEWIKAKERLFFDLDEWRAFLRKCDFSIGMRFHGNVLALWENVPALFITSDSRTRELCEHFSLPSIDISEFDKTKPIEYYYGLANYSKFHEIYAERVKEWKEFLRMNGLVEEKKQTKVLYQIGHFGFLINCFLHKLKYHKEDEAIFLIDKVIANNITLENFMDIQGNFKYIGGIYYYNDKDIIRQIDEIKNLEDCISEYFDQLLLQIGIRISDYTEIYSTFDTFNAFGVYLSLKQIKFNIIECTKNQCHSHDRYNLNKNINKEYDQVIEKYKVLSADAEYCQKLYSYDNSDFGGKTTIYNNAPTELLSNLSTEDIMNLVTAYDIKLSNNFEGLVYIMNSGWMAGANGLKFPKGYFYLNKKVIDCFFDDKKVILKPHPNTDFSDKIWKEQFPDFEIIPGFFPSFLISYLRNVKINGVITTGSSGANGITLPKMEIPFQIFESYKILNRLYVAIKVAQFIGVEEGQFFHYGIHNKLIWTMCKKILKNEIQSIWSKLDFPINSITIIDNIYWNPGDFKEKMIDNMRELSNNAVIIFINSRNDYIFLNEQMDFLPYLYEMRIEKTEYDIGIDENLNDEVIYLFCKDKKIINNVSNWRFKKRQVQQGYSLIVNGFWANKTQNDLSIKTDYILEKIKKI